MSTLKYVNTQVVFSEIPDEVTLAINISNCPCHCKGCHSSYLAEDIGIPLNYSELDTLIKENKGITCISFMGGDINPREVYNLCKYIQLNYPDIARAWYSGRQELPEFLEECEQKLSKFNYIKLGPYTEELGPLNSKTTNQRLYKVINNKLIDITNRFQKL